MCVGRLGGGGNAFSNSFQVVAENDILSPDSSDLSSMFSDVKSWNVSGLKRYKFSSKEYGLKKVNISKSFPIRKSTVKIHLPLPDVVLEYGVACLLRRLGGEEVVKILNVLMLERSILILGADQETVSICSSCIVDLLNPFKWQGTFIPVVPNTMVEFLSSPVPFVIGMVRGEGLKEKAKEEGVCVVDLERGEVWVEEVRVVRYPAKKASISSSLLFNLANTYRRRRFRGFYR